MAKLPLIVGLGGINAAGRSSGFHSYKLMIADVLSDDVMQSTWQDLAHRMGLSDDGAITEDIITAIKAGTCVRRIHSFDPDNLLYQYKANLNSADDQITFTLRKSKLPNHIPSNWQVDIQGTKAVITVMGNLDALVEGRVAFPVSSGGNIPTGFEPSKLYNSRFHPRGLSLTVYGASDALNSLGFEWNEVLRHIRPDEVSVYAGSGLAQIDDNSLGGMIAAHLTGGRVSSKMMALSFAEMPADFINGYVINSIGATGTNMGACATFLYNLRQGMHDIQHGKAKVVIVGNAEAPVEPEIMEGFRVMGALAEDEQLKALDGIDSVDNRRACRPFSSNAGFTMAESAQFVVLMDDELALELGANIYGSVADVFVNADANKKSISAPGVGNYVTVAKAAALAKAILGEEGMKQTFVQAHGTGTPQNRVTESHILNEVAKTFGIESWPVAAIKSYVGHSMSAAAGDQLVASLGVWQYGWLPAINTIDHIADDVHCSNLNILMDHTYAGEYGQNYKAVILNAKGFGGNNASGLVLSPQQTIAMLTAKYGNDAMAVYQTRNQAVKAVTSSNDANACQGQETIRYHFGEAVMDEHSVTITPDAIKLSEFEHAIVFDSVNPYEDYN
ncbi:beta-ketoacyl synthase [Photobacterium aquimaris]|uniref:Beta-ketoacyl synthase n=1 Tax=Photobacterium aquimaris TaxID=512643 RepID=A0A2T3HTJ0_9GAMM|nr:beta-ketoacyl synthase [Photobacterium aquimaris]OBU15430.1 beta-ketoacyl synthase [Photobacterium aquimaris]PQJ38536.1 beta-ketoacyl synthase [Photobacterium aquimaris]PST98163.1 beta-ketoacyl synthase [Photobacterium aquimaris]